MAEGLILCSDIWYERIFGEVKQHLHMAGYLFAGAAKDRMDILLYFYEKLMAAGLTYDFYNRCKNREL